MHLSVLDKNVPFSLKYLNHTSVWEKTIQSCSTVFPYALKTYKNMGDSLYISLLHPYLLVPSGLELLWLDESLKFDLKEIHER